MDQLSLSQSIIIDNPHSTVSDSDACKSHMGFATKILNRSGATSMSIELPDYTMIIRMQDKGDGMEPVATFQDKNNFPIFTAERSKKELYKSLVSLFD